MSKRQNFVNNRVELPPRKGVMHSEITIQRNKSFLEILMQIGFSKKRAEKALAATGEKGVQAATDWLLSHINDPCLDTVSHREYILYLCPVGVFQQNLMQFWRKSYAECGWNKIHCYFPHITLCSFFNAPDSLVPNLTHALKNIAEKQTEFPRLMNLEFFSSSNFIGLFVPDDVATTLKDMSREFAEKMNLSGIDIEPHKKQLHLSLAYGFSPEYKETLECLSRNIKTDVAIRWDVRLYSRDPRVRKAIVCQVVQAHVPCAHDELPLEVDDLIFYESQENEEDENGWVYGTSWETCISGMFPLKLTEQTAETETWTMHRSIPIIGSDIYGRSDSFDGKVLAGSTSDNQMRTVYTKLIKPPQNSKHANQLSSNHKQGSIELPASPKHQKEVPDSPHHVDRPEPKKRESKPEVKPRNQEHYYKSLIRPQGQRILYIVRHGERVDFTFGKDWISHAFDQSGYYIRNDLNMPIRMISRSGGPSDFGKDSPLTVQGHFQATVIGNALKEAQVPIAQVYASPSLRCVETAFSIVKALDVDLKINVEHGLFEYAGWYQSGLPSFLSMVELQDAGLPVSMTYKQIWSNKKLAISETVDQYYERSFQVTRLLLDRHDCPSDNILIVGHASSLDVCTRQLTGHSPRSHTDFHKKLHMVPYLAMAVAQEHFEKRNHWSIVEPPFPPFAHTNNQKYDWSVMIDS